MRITGKTRIYGLVGYPVEHSLSPAMQNAAFKKLSEPAEYRLFEIKPGELERFLLDSDFSVKDTEGNSVRAGDIAGFNVTIPYKVRAKEILEANFPYTELKKIEQDLYYVKLSGAINTIKRIDDRLEYRNTDAAGFWRSLKEDLEFEPEKKSALVIGCGGAGRAIIAALSWKNIGGGIGNKIYICDINEQTAASAEAHFKQVAPHLKDILKFISISEIPKYLEKCQLLVNASPVGMKEGDGSVVKKELLHDGLSVYDVIYNRQTQLIKDAESRKLPASGGRNMLLYQGVSALEFWMGWKEPRADIIDEMRQALYEAA